MKRLKYLTAINPPLPRDRVPKPDDEVSFLPMERIGEEGSLDLSEVRPARDISKGYTAMLDGDLVIAKITPCFENGKGALCYGLHGGMGFGTTELIVLRAKNQSDSRYLYWLTRGHHFRNWGEAEMRGSAGQKRVTEEFVSNYRSADLKLAEQRRIAGYLDEATGKVDRLVALRRRQMELLREQRAALIQQAVTRGLNPNAPLKDSGLPWLGRIPKHWQTTQVRRISSFVTSGSRGWAEFYSDSGDIFVQSGNLTREMTVELGNAQRIQPPVGAEGERTLIAHDDVLICVTGGLTGNVAFVDFHPPVAYINQHVALVRSRPHQVTPKFLATALWSVQGQTQFKLAEYGGTKQGLSLDDVRLAWIALPPMSEQIGILNFIQNESAQIDRLHSAYTRQLELLTEYRAALIHECVTGQRAVPAPEARA